MVNYFYRKELKKLTSQASTVSPDPTYAQRVHTMNENLERHREECRSKEAESWRTANDEYVVN